MPEEDEQIALASFLDEHFGALSVYWWHTPNGGKRAKHVADRMRQSGAKAGVCDVIIDLPVVVGRVKYWGTRLELKKTGGGRLQETQRRYLAAEALSGLYTRTVDGLAAAKALVRSLYPAPQPKRKEITLCYGCMAPLRGKEQPSPRQCKRAPGKMCRSKAVTFSTLEEFDALIEARRWEPERRVAAQIAWAERNAQGEKEKEPVADQDESAATPGQLPSFMRRGGECP